jgi:hypothetical protein
VVNRTRIPMHGLPMKGIPTAAAIAARAG